MALLTLARPTAQQELDDLELVEAGAQTAPDRDEVSYLWYNLREREDGRVHSGYRVVRLIELRSR